MKLLSGSPRTNTDPWTFDDFFREQFAGVARAAALVARDRDQGPDLAQEAFARAFERWDRMVSPEHARNFVYRVAINLARSQLRRARALPLGLSDSSHPTAPDPTAISADWIVVAEALGALSARQRACVVLTDYADLDAASVARILGITPDTVRVHLMRGRHTLRDRLARTQVEDR